MFDFNDRVAMVTFAAKTFGLPDTIAYTVAKHAVVGMTRTAAVDCARMGIRVNAVGPAIIDTPLIRAQGEPSPALIDQHPIDRLGGTEGIARSILFLVEDEAGFATDATLSINSGKYMARSGRMEGKDHDHEYRSLRTRANRHRQLWRHPQGHGRAETR